MAGDVNIKLSDRAKPILNGFKVIKGFAGKTSISALAKDLIMQFPVLISASIDTDDIVAIAKSLEKMYASMFVAVWTADASFGVTDTNMHGVRDFVRKYHNNNDIPDVITYGGDLLKLADKLFGLEATLTDANAIPNNSGMSSDEVMKLWATTENSLSLESINDFYLPEVTARNRINAITAALEASNNKKPKITSDTVKNAVKHVNNNSINYDTGDWKKAPRGISPNTDYAKSVNKFEIQKNEKLSSLEPTLIDMSFLVHGPGAGTAWNETVKEPIPVIDPKTGKQKMEHGKPVWERDSNGNIINETKNKPHDVIFREQHAVVGVKTMLRLIPSQYMVPNVIASIQDQSLAFNFIKWTKGEYKIGRDMLLKISRMRADANPSDIAEAWFAALRKRKRAAGTFKFSETGINPFATLVITTDEVEEIKASSGYDLMQRDVCHKLMNNLFLLGLMIVNTNTGLVYSIFDGFEDYSNTTIKALKAQRDKNSTLDELREIRQIMGRM